jgi:hypothetical protein
MTAITIAAHHFRKAVDHTKPYETSARLQRSPAVAGPRHRLLQILHPSSEILPLVAAVAGLRGKRYSVLDARVPGRDDRRAPHVGYGHIQTTRAIA